MGSLYLWDRSIQEIGGDVVIGHSIYRVVVIDGSLYSRLYGKLIHRPEEGLNLKSECILVSAMVHLSQE